MFGLAFDKKLLLSSSVFFLLSTLVWVRVVNGVYDSFSCRVILGLCAVCGYAGSFLYLWLFCQSLSPRRGLVTLMLHIVRDAITRLRGKRFINKVLTECGNPMEQQLRLMQRIIRRNGRTSYGREHGLEGVTSLEDLRAQHPLTRYGHYRSYVQRMMDGEGDLLIAGKVGCFVSFGSHGGKAKYIPTRRKRSSCPDIDGAMLHVAAKDFQAAPLAKRLFFSVAVHEEKAICGADIVAGDAAQNGYDWFNAAMVTPPAGYKIASMFEALYVQLLFGLFDPDIDTFACSHVFLFETAMKILEGHWQQLVDDVKEGTLRPDLKLPIEVRESLEAVLQRYGGDPNRAADLRREFTNNFRGIAKRIWPKSQVVFGNDSSSAWPRLQQTYAQGLQMMTIFDDFPEASPLVFCPGSNIMDSGFIPLVNEVIFEFIKEDDCVMDQPPTHFLDGLERDHRYEMVITNQDGLYRYRTDTIVEVVGSHGNMPIIDFAYRLGEMLNVRNERLDCRVVQESIRAAAARWSGKCLHEFAATESTILIGDCTGLLDSSELMPYYIFFVELEKSHSPQTITEEEKRMIDEELRGRHADYERLRSQGAISHPRVYIVGSGAFGELRQLSPLNMNEPRKPNEESRKLGTYEMIESILEYLV